MRTPEELAERTRTWIFDKFEKEILRDWKKQFRELVKEKKIKYESFEEAFEEWKQRRLAEIRLQLETAEIKKEDTNDETRRVREPERASEEPRGSFQLSHY